jgi:hypothetical protein
MQLVWCQHFSQPRWIAARGTRSALWSGPFWIAATSLFLIEASMTTKIQETAALPELPIVGKEPATINPSVSIVLS